MDTVELNGEGFTLNVRQGQRVKKGELLVTVDVASVSKTKSVISPIVFMNGLQIRLLKQDAAVQNGEDGLIEISMLESGVVP